MKIIALVLVKNEEWILPTYLSGVQNIADEIIALDDGSIDNSVRILKKSEVIVKTLHTKAGEFIPMSVKRNHLLTLGRKRKGTHFVFLDADEIFTYSFRKNGKNILKGLKSGQKILMRWYTLWKSYLKYRDDENILSRQIRSFIFCDDKTSSFSNNYLSESRTPGVINIKNTLTLPEPYGVLHFQFLFWEQVQIKQAWYRCLELIKQPKKYNAINYLYSPSLNELSAKLNNVPRYWLKELDLPTTPNIVGSKLKIKEILIWFDKYGIDFFESLQIWHIPVLRNEFIKRTGRNPRNYFFYYGYSFAKQSFQLLKGKFPFVGRLYHKFKEISKIAV